MQVKSLTMLRVLLNRFHKNPTAVSLSCLSDEDAKKVMQLDVTSDNPALALAQPEEMLVKIHYSWLLSALQELPNQMRLPALAALPKSYSDKLKPLAGYNQDQSSNLSLAPAIKTFLLQKMYAVIQKSTPLPLEFLPQSQLKPLVELDKSQLIEIIDLLGIYDLTEEVKHIIDKDRLTKIYNCLTSKQRQFLRVCLHQKEKISSSPLNLEAWKGDCKEFQKLLHNRGIVRLGKGLWGQHPDFVWYLTHKLDSGRGNLLSSYYKEDINPHITPILVQQIINLMNFLFPKRNP